jgi:hypothetical protein
MANIFPPFEQIKQLKVQPTEGELHLLQYLSNKFNDVDDVEIFFQPYLNGDNPDIILMQQHVGVIIIEVKDWNLNSYFLGREKNNFGKWLLKNNNHEIKSPFEQVYRYKENMFDLHVAGLLEKKLREPKFYGRINVFVYFHKASSDQLKAFYHPLISKTERDIPNIPIEDKKYRKYLIYQHTKLKKQIDYYARGYDNIDKIEFPKHNENLFTDDIYLEFKRILKPSFHTLEQGREINYTKRQQELSQSKNVQQKIKGVAGSGKTLVLAKRAVNAHKRHSEKVLILTFNISLTSYIHDMISDVRENFEWKNFTILHYHLFFSSAANNYLLDINDEKDYENIDFFESTAKKIKKYKTILIDEIQDYKEEWIRIIKKYFWDEGGEFVVFGDEKQNIYGRKLDETKKPNTTIVGAWNLLNESFRLTTKIALLAEKFQNSFFMDKYDIDNIQTIKKTQGTFDFETNIMQINTFQNIETLAKEILETIKKYQIHSNDICILSYKIETLRNLDFFIRKYSQEKTNTTFETKEFYDFLTSKYKEHPKIFETEIKNIRRVKKISFRLNSGTMKLSTIHSFKGWEAPTLFLVIDEDEHSTHLDEAIYIAITRARQNLIIYESKSGRYYNFFQKNMS